MTDLVYTKSNIFDNLQGATSQERLFEFAQKWETTTGVECRWIPCRLPNSNEPKNRKPPHDSARTFNKAKKIYGVPLSELRRYLNDPEWVSIALVMGDRWISLDCDSIAAKQEIARISGLPGYVLLPSYTTEGSTDHESIIYKLPDNSYARSVKGWKNDDIDLDFRLGDHHYQVLYGLHPHGRPYRITCDIVPETIPEKWINLIAARKLPGGQASLSTNGHHPIESINEPKNDWSKYSTETKLEELRLAIMLLSALGKINEDRVTWLGIAGAIRDITDNDDEGYYFWREWHTEAYEVARQYDCSWGRNPDNFERFKNGSEGAFKSWANTEESQFLGKNPRTAATYFGMLQAVMHIEKIKKKSEKKEEVILAWEAHLAHKVKRTVADRRSVIEFAISAELYNGALTDYLQEYSAEVYRAISLEDLKDDWNNEIDRLSSEDSKIFASGILKRLNQKNIHADRIASKCKNLEAWKICQQFSDRFIDGDDHTHKFFLGLLTCISPLLPKKLQVRTPDGEQNSTLHTLFFGHPAQGKSVYYKTFANILMELGNDAVIKNSTIKSMNQKKQAVFASWEKKVLEEPNKVKQREMIANYWQAISSDDLPGGDKVDDILIQMKIQLFPPPTYDSVYAFSDFTTEALDIKIIEHENNSILLFCDELAKFKEAMGNYGNIRDIKQAGDNLLIRLKEGDYVTRSRVTGDPDHERRVKSSCSFVSSIQWDRMSKYLDFEASSGWLSRVTMVAPLGEDEKLKPKHLKKLVKGTPNFEAEYNKTLKAYYETLQYTIANVIGEQVIDFEDLAYPENNDYQDWTYSMMEQSENLSLKNWYKRLMIQVSQIALLLWAIEVAENPLKAGSEISLDIWESAMTIGDYLEVCARKVYGEDGLIVTRKASIEDQAQEKIENDVVAQVHPAKRKAIDHILNYCKANDGKYDYRVKKANKIWQKTANPELFEAYGIHKKSTFGNFGFAKLADEMVTSGLGTFDLKTMVFTAND